MPKVVLLIEDLSIHHQFFQRAVRSFCRSSSHDRFEGFARDQETIRRMRLDPSDEQLYSINIGKVGSEETQFIAVNRADLALEIIKSRHNTTDSVDLIFVDRNGPYMDGDNTIREIRKLYLDKLPGISYPYIHYYTSDKADVFSGEAREVLALVNSGPDKLLNVRGFKKMIIEQIPTLRAHTPTQRRATIGAIAETEIAVATSEAPVGTFAGAGKVATPSHALLTIDADTHNTPPPMISNRTSVTFRTPEDKPRRVEREPEPIYAAPKSRCCPCFWNLFKKCHNKRTVTTAAKPT